MLFALASCNLLWRNIKYYITYSLAYENWRYSQTPPSWLILIIANNNKRSVLLEIKTAGIKSLKYWYFSFPVWPSLIFAIRILARLDDCKFLPCLEKVVKEGVDILSANKTIELLKLPALESLTSSESSELNKRNLTCVWCLESEMEGIEIEDKDHVRIRTKGNGPYLGKAFLVSNLRFSEESSLLKVLLW